MASLAAQMVKRLSTMQETWVRALGWEDPWRRNWQPTPGLLPGKSHGQRSLIDYSPRGRKESDTTEQLHYFTKCHLINSTQISSHNRAATSILRYPRPGTAASFFSVSLPPVPAPLLPFLLLSPPLALNPLIQCVTCFPVNDEITRNRKTD